MNRNVNEVLKCHQLSLSLAQSKGFLHLIADFNMSLYHGKTVGLVGESGCGKSLTAQSILRLLPIHAHYSHFSKILFQKKDLLNLPLFQMREIRGKKISMVFQEPMMALNPVKTFYSQIADVIQAHQTISRKHLHQRIMALMNDVELYVDIHQLFQYPHQWSGGQKQRFLIAMALANQPDVLLADEPTTALDVVVQKQILMLLKKLQAQYGLAILLISHDLNVVKSLADDVILMYAGQVIEQAPAAQFWDRPLHPYAHMLMKSVPSYAKREYRLSVIPGAVPSFYDEPSGCRFHPRCSYATLRCQNQIPQWQQISDQQAVRCHLYPRTYPLEMQSHSEPKLEISELSHQMILEIKNVSVTVSPVAGKAAYSALKNISFSLAKGQTLAIIGESGSGKTTLARVIMGLHPKQSGDINIIQPYQLRDIQMIFQDASAAMNPRWRVHEILREAYRSQDENQLFWIMDAVQLAKNTLARYPHELSGGQRQRVAIARALLAKPKILICDEPTSALDISVQAQTLNLLKNIQYEFSLSYILITHDLDVVTYMADEVCVLRDGTIIEKGNIEEIIHSPQQEYTRTLLSAHDFSTAN